MNAVTVTLQELRLRAIYCVCSWSLCVCVCFQWIPELLYVVGRPVLHLHDRFQFFDAGEAFSTWITLACLWACLGVVPVVLYHLWCFILPSRYVCERHTITRGGGVVLGLVCVEGALVYGWVFPAVAHFLITMPASSDTVLAAYGVEFAARLGTYVGFCVTFFATLLVLCQVPLVLGVVGAFHGVTGPHLATMRRWVVLTVVLCSAVVSPPDVLSQGAMTLWGVVMFELTVIYGCVSQCVTRAADGSP
jgi:sec-independent protein translocase protein TatC